ncbi:MAG: LON peptidase substrate-binding domain-containing protein [Thermoanaerobaculia bacterium]|nr:LON peptidase substrate-binding domain-containing protein [Thermoanaerobaculia bacterium]
MTVRRLLPLFPLPNVLLLPETDLPLHVFEPRYQAMLSDVLAGERLLGIQLLNPAGLPDDAGRPAVFEVGCAGEVVEHESLEDGRSNILLRGTFRYRIAGEPDTRTPYRVAEVVPLPIRPLPAAAGGRSRRDLRRTLAKSVERLADSVGRAHSRSLPPELSDEGFVNEALSRLGLDAEEGYRVLVMDRLEERYDWALAHIAGVQKRLDFLAPFRRPELDSRWN